MTECVSQPEGRDDAKTRLTLQALQQRQEPSRPARGADVLPPEPAVPSNAVRRIDQGLGACLPGSTSQQKSAALPTFFGVRNDSASLKGTKGSAFGRGDART